MWYDFTNTSSDYTGIVTAQKVYEHLRLIEPGSGDTPPDSAYIDTLILSAIDFVERYTGIPLLPKTVRMSYASNKEVDGAYLLKFITDLSSPTITSITYRDEDGASQTFDVANAYINNIIAPNEVVIKPGYELDDAYTDIQITYSITAPRYPVQAVHAVLMVLAYYYENRTTATSGAGFNSIKNHLDIIKINMHP